MLVQSGSGRARRIDGLRINRERLREGGQRARRREDGANVGQEPGQQGEHRWTARGGGRTALYTVTGVTARCEQTPEGVAVPSVAGTGVLIDCMPNSGKGGCLTAGMAVVLSHTGRMPLPLALAFTLLLAAPVSASAQAVVSELGWAGSDLSAADEWLEIAPLSATGSLSLSGWTLHALTSAGMQKLLDLGPVTLSGAAIVVSNYAETQSRLLVAPAVVTTAVSLSNTDLRLELRRPDGTVADEVVLGSKPAGYTGSHGDLWASAERIDPWQSGANPANWRSAETMIGLDDGSPMLGTPGLVPWLIIGASSGGSATSASSSNESVASSESSSSSVETGSGDILDGAVLALSSSSSSAVTPATSSSSAPPASSSSAAPDGLVGGFRITEVMADPPGSDDGEWVEVGNLSEVPLSVEGVLLQRRGLSRTYRFVEIFGTGATFAPGEHRVVSRERSLITLPNAGGELLLTHGQTLVDSFTYPAADEGVSSGLLDGELAFFCVPTPGEENVQTLPRVGILVQGGTLTGVGTVSVNVAADMPDIPGDSSCRVDFGDGEASESCNPGSHTFSQPGTYDLALTVSTLCGVIHADPLVVHVAEAQVDQTAPASSRSSAAASSKKSTATSSSSEAGQRSCSPSAATGVFIAGALPNPADADEDFEVIVLRSLNDEAVDLCGWVLDDGPEGSKPFRLDGQTIPAHGELRLLRPVTGIALNNDGDVIRLFRPGDAMAVSTVAYDTSREDEYVGPLAQAEVTEVVLSLEDEHVAQPWEQEKSPPSHAGVAAASAAPGEIIINELMSHPQSGQPEWIELRNLAARTVDLSGWTLDDAPSGGSAPWLIPHGTSIAPHGYAVFLKTETKLSLNDSGDQVELRRGSQLLDSVELPVLKTDIAYAREGEDGWCKTDRPTPGSANLCASASPLQSKVNDAPSTSFSSQQLGLLASLKQGTTDSSDPHSNSDLGWIAWSAAALLLLGAVVWAWMHIDEWRWKLQQVAE